MSATSPTEPPAPAAAPQGARVPAARVGLLRQAWQLLLAAALGLPLAALVAAWGVLHSERGTAWLLAGVPGLQVSAPQGALLGRAFSAESVIWRWDQGRKSLHLQGLQWTGAQWRWWLRAGTWAGVQVEQLSAQRITVNSGPASGKAPTAPSSLSLPLEADIRLLQVQRLEVDSLPPFLEIKGHLALGADQGVAHRVEDLAFRWDELQAHGKASLRAVAPLTVEAHLALKGTAAMAWEADVQASGHLQALDLQARLRAPAQASGVRPWLDGSVQLKPFEPWPLGTANLALQALDLAQISSSLPTTRLTGRAQIKSQSLHQPVQADVVLDNGAAGPWGEGRLPVRRAQIDLRSRPDARESADLLHLDLDFGSLQRPAGQWRSRGQWSAGKLSLQGTAADIRPHLLDPRAPAMTLSGPLQLAVSAEPLVSTGARNPPTRARSWALELQGSLNGALEGGLGQRATLIVEGLQIKPQEIQLRGLQAQSGAAKAELSATITSTQGGAVQVRSEGRIAEFDPVPWIPGEPAAAWRQGPHRLNAQWALDVAAPVRGADINSIGAALRSMVKASMGSSASDAVRWLQQLQGAAQVELAPSRLAGLPAAGSLRLTQNPTAPVAERNQLKAELRLGRNQMSLSGQGDPAGSGEADRWQVQIGAAALNELGALSAWVPQSTRWWPQAGSVSARLQATGRWPAMGSEGEIRIAGLTGRDYALARAEVNWKWSGRDAEPLSLRGELQEAALGPNRLARLRGDLQGTLRQHSARLDVALPLQPPEVMSRVLALPSGAGTQARLSLEGAWSPQAAGGGRWSGRIQQLEAGVWSGVLEQPGTEPVNAPHLPPERAWLAASDLRGELSFDNGWHLRSVRMDSGQAALAAGLRLKWEEARYDVGDTARANRPDFQWQAEVLPFALAPWLQRAQTGLQWSGDLRLRARMAVRAAQRFEAELSLQRHDGDLQVVEGGQVQRLGLSAVDLSLSAKEGLWAFEPRLVGLNVGEISGAMQLRTDPAARWPNDASLLSGSVQARVPNLGVWSGWVPPGWRIQGQAVTTASLGGRFGAPQLTGELLAQGVGVRNLLQGVDYSDGELRVALQGDTARIERLRLRSGEGQITGEGVAELGNKPSARVRVRAEGFRVLGRFDRQLVGSGQAVLALQPDALKLDGRVTIDSGLFDLASRDAPTLDDDVTVRGLRDTAAFSAPNEPAVLPRLIRQSSIALDVDLGQKLRLKGRGLDTALQGELKLSTPGGRLAVNGTVRTQGGTYAAYGQNLNIERGIVAFTGRADTPRLDILALRPNTDIRVGVVISGTPQAPRARLVSEPEMGETDKLSWLLLGRGSEGLGRTDTSVLQRAAVALLAGEGQAPTDSLLRAIGIDDLSVRQADGEGRETIVHLGKQLSRNWYAGYERGVNATAGTFQLIYRVAQRFTLRAQSGLENSLDLIWTWRFDQAPLVPAKRGAPP